MNIKINIHIIFILALGLILMASCKRVIVKIESIPQNTPEGQTLFVTGNFNNWDPGDENYQLTLEADSNYYVRLPSGFGVVEYKFTRGDWTSVEKDICGVEIGNRTLVLANIDTLTTEIESWSDLDPINCPKLTIKLENIPKNTPEEDVIAIASNLNSWDPDYASIFVKDQFGHFYVNIYRPKGTENLEYKITRGNLSASESDEFGNEILKRVGNFGKKDTITLDVKGWTDLPLPKSHRVVFIIKNLPKNTPPNANIFLSSNLNSWVPGDNNYHFQKNKNGQFYFTLPRKKLLLEYKITRGNWSTVEVDRNGYDIENRNINLQNEDTVFIDVKRWNDTGGSNDDKITVVLNKIPDSTPGTDKIYISGNFNGWNPGKLRYAFNRNRNGDYYVNLPRKDSDLEFRITRGSMKSVQVDKYGTEVFINNYSYNDIDTLNIEVENWSDLPKNLSKNITLVLNQIPDNTPGDAVLFLAPDFNNWNPNDLDLTFDNLKDGRPAITIPISGKSMNYKITRGGWSTVEVDDNGDEISDRNLYYGFADTVYINVIKWRDLDGNY